MDKCKYFLKINGTNLTFDSDAELTEFVKDNIENKNDKLFVKYSKTDSGFETKQEEVLNIINHREKFGLSPYNENYISRSTFLSLNHSIDGQPSELLSPVLMQENYINNSVMDIIKADPNLSTLYKTDPDEALNKAKEYLVNELKKDNRMKDLSIAMSSLMSSMIKEKKAITQNEVKSIFSLVAQYNLHDKLTGNIEEDKKLVDQYIKDNFTLDVANNFRNQLQLWYKGIIDSNNQYIANVWMHKQLNIQGQPGIKSRAPYVSVSPEGRVDLFEIAVSRNEYSDWHSAKKLTFDFRLGVNRQLMANLTDVSSSSMFIQPVIFPEINGEIQLKNFHIANKEDRSKFDSNPMFSENGKHTLALRQLLPAEKKVSIQEGQKFTEQAQKILGIMFPKYNFRTKLITNDYMRKYNSIIESSEGQPKLFIYDDSGNKIEEENTPEGRERFKEIVKNVVEESNANKNSKVVDLMKSIREIKESSSENKLLEEIKFRGGDVNLQRMFNKYLSDDWTLISERADLLNAGILLFKNNSSLVVEAVALTVNNLNQVNNLGVGNTLLGKFKKNSFLKADDKVLSAKTSNIETMKVLTVLNNDPSILNGYSLNTIKVFDMFTNTGDYTNLDLALYNFDLLLKEVNEFEPVENNFSGNKPKIKVTDTIKALYAEIVSSATALANSKVKSWIDPIDKIDELTDNKARLEWFKSLRDKLVREYNQLSSLDPTKIQDFSDPRNYLYYLVSSGITYYSGIDSVFDYENPRYGISGGDMTHWLRTSLLGTAPDYDENGNKIVGLFQGQHFNTTDALQSVYMTKLHDIITIVQNEIVSDVNKKKNLIINATNKYYEEIGRSSLGKLLIGASDQYHEVFFETHNGKITNDFMLKNPWDTYNSLTTPQRKYLKNFIFSQYSNSRKANADITSVEKFENSQELSELLATGKIETFLKVPLIKKQSLSRFKALTTDGFRKFVGQTWDSVKNLIDPRDLTGTELEERQKVGAYNSINGLNKMYNQFDSQESNNFRDSLIRKYGTSYFEVNLDTIALKYMYENVREKRFNTVFPTLSAAITTMKFFGWQSGKTEETEKALEDFWNQVKVAVFNQSLVKDSELGTALGIIKAAQRSASFMTLALRPAAMAKELTVGMIKNASFAWSRVYGDDSFGSKELTKAYGLLLNTQKNFDIVANINTLYRVANRDINQIVDKVKVDRTGLNFLGGMFYWCNTAPDYVNRLSLFLAKMVKDGCYDAHSVDADGNLIYDTTKDNRFSYYFEMNDRYGNKWVHGDEKYNDQRNRYLIALDEFNEERNIIGEKPLVEGDMLPRAYTSKERDSIKSFCDTAYGYYDTERSPLIKHLPVGIVFGQYATFWPSFVKYYFGKPGQKSKRGYMNHKQRNNNGVIEKYFVKFETDPETGDEYRMEVPESQLTDKDPRIPAWEWIGEPSEGIMYSLALTTRALFKGDLDSVDPQRMKQAKIGLHDMIIALMALLLGSFLTSDSRKSQTDNTKLTQYQKVGLKILSRATSEFNPFSNLGGPLSGEPSFMKKWGQVYTDVNSVISGNSDLEKFMRNNFNMLELVPKFETRNY